MNKNTNPSNSNTNPSNSNTNPSNSNTNPSNSNTNPLNSNTNPLNSNTNPLNSNTNTDENPPITEKEQDFPYYIQATDEWLLRKSTKVIEKLCELESHILSGTTIQNLPFTVISPEPLPLDSEIPVETCLHAAEALKQTGLNLIQQFRGAEMEVSVRQAKANIVTGYCKVVLALRKTQERREQALKKRREQALEEQRKREEERIKQEEERIEREREMLHGAFQNKLA